jgi:hypothetical protein
VRSEAPLGPERLYRNTPRLAPLQPYELTPGQRAARDRLSPERREMFDDLFAKFQGQKLSFPRLNSYTALGKELSEMLRTGVLDKKDRNGVDVLTNLSNMSKNARIGYIKSDELTAQAIASVCVPSSTIRQGDHGTCAATTVEYMLARRNPAEYVRIAAGLCSEKGEVAMPNGEMCRRIEDSTYEDKSGRMPLERVMQSAFMSFAAAPSKVGEYSNVRDGFLGGDKTKAVEQTVGGPASNLRSGLWVDETTRLTEAAMNEKYATLLEDGKDSSAAVAQMEKILEKNPGSLIPATLQWGKGRHRVVVTGIKDGRVEFRNPWGDRKDSPGISKLPDVDHQILGNGFESVPLDAFAARVKHMLVPERLMTGLQG